jgi:hypothetical protein
MLYNWGQKIAPIFLYQQHFICFLLEKINIDFEIISQLVNLA